MYARKKGSQVVQRRRKTKEILKRGRRDGKGEGQKTKHTTLVQNF